MKLFLSGHTGLVGSAIWHRFNKASKWELITKTRSELDLTDQASVLSFLKREKPEVVVVASAKVGGILANSTFPAEFIYENLQIQNNLIHGSHLADVQQLLFLGSSCIYPKHASQPISESELLAGPLEATNDAYAIAKIAGLKMCASYRKQYGRDYRALMPTNLYGPRDNFHPTNSHVIAALLGRFHRAKLRNDENVTVWGTGRPKREFMYVEDFADAVEFALGLSERAFYPSSPEEPQHLNVGIGRDVSIAELSSTIANVVSFQGAIEFDASKPDGTMRKLLDNQRLTDFGWRAKTDLADGLAKTYGWCCENAHTLKNQTHDW